MDESDASDSVQVSDEPAPTVKSRWPGRIGVAAGALVAIGGVVAMLIAVSGPRPDATLAKTGEGASLDVLALINSDHAFVHIYGSTLRAHESFQGWDIFTGSNTYGAPCLVVIAPTEDFVRVECTPAPAKQVADSHPYTQPDGPMIRFIVNGDIVEAWVYPHAKADS